MNIVEEIDDPKVPIVQACVAIGVSRATLYRNTQPAKLATVTTRAPSPRRLSDLEQKAVIEYRLKAVEHRLKLVKIALKGSRRHVVAHGLLDATK